MVFHQHRQGVFDGDAIAKHALVAEIVVFMLGVEVQRFELFVVRHIQREGIIFGFGIAVGAWVELRDAAVFCIFFAIELQAAFGVHALRVAGQPEVHQVEVVGGFVHQQAAAVALFTVPAAEVVRAVLGVEQPLKVNGSDVANHPLHQQFTHFAVVRRVAIVKGHAHGMPGLFDGIEDTQRAFFINGHRFFGDHIAARMQRTDDIVIVGTVHGGDDDDIRARFADHLFELYRFPGGYRLCAFFLQ